ncbi:hydrogenase accessory protein HypB [Hahella sp. CCB-MM4]|nr:hydrogenase accessory protein HypB [Hahella sp. CCB-MM4]
MCTTCGCSGAASHHHSEHDLSEDGLSENDLREDSLHTSGSHTHDHQNSPDSHIHHHNDQARILEVEQSILSKNDRFAADNRQRLKAHNVASFNLVSSPGSGKTSLLVRTIEQLRDKAGIAVIEGDQQTELDATRIRETGAPAIQINTGKGCHLDAHQIGHALDHWDLDSVDLIFIENVGNLVCPAAFDLGETARVAVLSVTEGEDKPLKYPDMFYGSDLMLINKIDLLPYVDFDVAKSIEYARRINPDIEVIQLSAKTGEGMTEWTRWCLQHLEKDTSIARDNRAESCNTNA